MVQGQTARGGDQALDEIGARAGFPRHVEEALIFSCARVDTRPFGVTVDPLCKPYRRETVQRVVLSHGKTKLRARGEESVGLIHSARDEVVHEHADIGTLATKYERCTIARAQSGIQPRERSLPSCFFVAGSAIDLSGEEQPFNGADLEPGMQLRGRIIVVLDRIAGTRHLHLLKATHRAQHLDLHLGGERGGEAVHVQLMRVEPLGL